MIYGRSKFTLVNGATKTKCKSRPLPGNEATMCGSQDLNSRVKIKLEDSYFVVETSQTSNNAQCTNCRPYCLETNIVNHIADSKKSTDSIQLGYSNVLLERSNVQTLNVSENRLVTLQ